MRYEALGEEWELAFPFKVQRELEERYNKGFYGIARMVAPNISGDIDLDKDPVKLLDAIGELLEDTMDHWRSREAAKK